MGAEVKSDAHMSMSTDVDELLRDNNRPLPGLEKEYDEINAILHSVLTMVNKLHPDDTINVRIDKLKNALQILRGEEIQENNTESLSFRIKKLETALKMLKKSQSSTDHILFTATIEEKTRRVEQRIQELEAQLLLENH